MVVDEISEMLEKRRAELVDVLESREDIELEKQHQMYGAINEIDLFLQTLNFYEKEKPENNFGTVRLVKPPEPRKGIFSRIFDGFKERVLRNR